MSAMSELHAELSDAGAFDDEPGEGDMPTRAELFARAEALSASPWFDERGMFCRNPDDAARRRLLAAERAARDAARFARDAERLAERERRDAA